MIRAVLALLMLTPASGFGDTLTALRVVRPNAVIAPGDVSVTEASVPGALRSSDQAVGFEARVTLYPGRPIMPGHVGAAAVVERNQPVTLIYRQAGLIITTDARALSRGAIGDTVRVMNLASRTTVSGTVRRDGSVEVAAEGIAR